MNHTCHQIVTVKITCWFPCGALSAKWSLQDYYTNDTSQLVQGHALFLSHILQFEQPGPEQPQIHCGKIPKKLPYRVATRVATINKLTTQWFIFQVVYPLRCSNEKPNSDYKQHSTLYQLSPEPNKHPKILPFALTSDLATNPQLGLKQPQRLKIKLTLQGTTCDKSCCFNVCNTFDGGSHMIPFSNHSLGNQRWVLSPQVAALLGIQCARAFLLGLLFFFLTTKQLYNY